MVAASGILLTAARFVDDCALLATDDCVTPSPGRRATATRWLDEIELPESVGCVLDGERTIAARLDPLDVTLEFDELASDGERTIAARLDPLDTTPEFDARASEEGERTIAGRLDPL